MGETHVRKVIIGFALSPVLARQPAPKLKSVMARFPMRMAT